MRTCLTFFLAATVLAVSFVSTDASAGDFTIVALGDSTTARRPGIESVYAERLATFLEARGIRARVVNAGVPRHNTIDARDRFEKDVLALDPAVVIIQFGINDSFVDVDKGSDRPRVGKEIFEQNIRYFAAALESNGARVILMTSNPLYWTSPFKNRFGKPPYDVDDTYGFNLHNAEYAASVRNIAAELDIPLIDVYQYYIDRDNDQGKPGSALLLDGMHPNDDGHAVVARLLGQTIRRLHSRILSIPLIDLSSQHWRRGPAGDLLADESEANVTAPSPDGQGLVRLGARPAGLFWLESNDGGETWSELCQAPASLEGDCHTIVQTHDGRYVVAFRDRFEGSPTFGDFLFWVGTGDDVTGGRSGSYRARLIDDHSGLDSPVLMRLEPLADGSFCLSAQCVPDSGTETQSLSVRFGLDETEWAATRGEPFTLLGHRGKVRVACVGDTITAGQGVVNRRKYAFPAQLGKMLGVKWEVRNYGIPGATVLQKGNKPYVAEEEFEKILKWNPHVVIFSFGAADSLAQNWPHSAEFVNDYKAMVRRFDTLRAAPRIWLCDLPPIFAGHRQGSQSLTARNGVRALIWETARSKRLPVIDLFTPLDNHPGLLVNGVLPNAGGAHLLAGAVYKALTGKRWIFDGELPVETAPLEPPQGEKTVFVDGSRTPGAYGTWYARKNCVEGYGQHNLLQADKGIGAGDFCIEARLRMSEQSRSDAAFFLGRSYFGFEGSRGTLFLNGPLFGGKHVLEPSSTAFKSGAWFDFRVIRRGRTLQFQIDGNAIHTLEDDARPFGPIGFSPARSSMQVSHFSLTGPAIDVDPPMPHGYAIPIVDISGDEQRQVVVDREEGQYLGHPTTVLLEDSLTMICVYPKGHGRGAIVMKRSLDAGLTWSDRLATPASWATSKEVPTIHRVMDASGKKRLIMFSGLYPIRMAVSEDDGDTWSELEPIGDFGGIVAMGDVIALNEPGHYMALFHDDGRFLHDARKAAGRMEVYKTFSRDGGLTWSAPETIISRSDVGLCEPGMIRSPDGKTIAVLMRENYRHRNSHVMFTSDEGVTFTEPRELPGSLTGDRHKLRYAPDGRIVATFRDTTLESRTKGDWVGWVGTWDDIVKGSEGQYRIRFMDNHSQWDCAYPGLELLPDGTFVTTTYGHWTKGQKPYIVSVRFKLDELDTIAARLSEEKKK